LRPMKSLAAPKNIAETSATTLAPIRISEDTLLGTPFTTFRKADSPKSDSIRRRHRR